MIKSVTDNLFSSIFPDESQYVSSIVKLLLLLESEQLIPLFKIREYSLKYKALSAFVSNRDHQHISVSSILNKSIVNSESILFYGSNFQVLLGEKLGNQKLVTDAIETFLILTTQGLILENDDITQDLNQNKYQFIEWDCWQNITLTFDKKEPKCSLIFMDKQGYFMEINAISNSELEHEKIEKQLPLIFCYLTLKRFWKYVEKMRNDNFLVFNPEDFINFNAEKLAYFTNNILAKIDISEADLSNLMMKIINR